MHSDCPVIAVRSIVYHLAIFNALVERYRAYNEVEHVGIRDACVRGLGTCPCPISRTVGLTLKERVADLEIMR